MLGTVQLLAPMTRGNVDPHSKAAMAERLLLLRVALGYTQVFACRLIGVSQSMWAYWESPGSARMPTRQQLLEIELKMGAPMEWVTSGIGARMPRNLLEKLTDAAERLDSRKYARRRND